MTNQHLPVISSDEMASINMLTVKEIKGLFVYARKKLDVFQRNGTLHHLTEEDIVHTAFEKTLTKERQWNPDTCDVYHYFLGVISSLIYNEGQRKRQRNETHDTEFTEYQSVPIHGNKTTDILHILCNKEEIDKIIRVVRKKNPKLLPLIQTMYLERTDKPKVLAEILNKNVTQIYSEKKQLLRLCQQYVQE